MTVEDAPSHPDPVLSVTVHQQDQAVILEARGAVDLRSVERLRDGIAKTLTEHPHLLVIDLSAVTFFGSSGLAVLSQAKAAAAERTELCIVADTPAVLRPLRVTGLDHAFSVYSSREAALRA